MCRCTRRLSIVLLLAGAMLGLASCKEQSTTNGSGTGAGGTRGQEPAAIAATAVTATATVQAIDRNKRTVTLERPDGTTVTYTIGKDVVNFDQIEVGDQVRATVIDALAVYVGKPGAAPSAGAGEMIALAPRGARPGTVMARTVEITDRIEAVDRTDRTIKIQGVSGKPQTLKVGPDVNLDDLKKGDDVVIRATEALAIRVEKPESSGMGALTTQPASEQ